MIIFASANVSYYGRYTYRHRAHDNAFQLLAGGRQFFGLSDKHTNTLCMYEWWVYNKFKVHKKGADL